MGLSQEQQNLVNNHLCLACKGFDNATLRGALYCNYCQRLIDQGELKTKYTPEGILIKPAKRKNANVQQITWRACVLCGQQDERTRSGKRYCQACFDKRARRTNPGDSSHYYYRNLGENRCASCGKPLPKDYEYTRCPECREKRKRNE